MSFSTRQGDLYWLENDWMKRGIEFGVFPRSQLADQPFISDESGTREPVQSEMRIYA